ncbi:N-acetyl sugar amidotransferase [Candidatus Woesearchaeota archaeon]|nr:N-acetyl sugar amidotransferase [Candidatus Woesearchaeota archaeon]
MVSKKILDRQLPDLPQEIKFCRKCVVSNQRPRIILDEEGVCSACRFAYEKEHAIDWKEREDLLRKLCDKYRRNDGRFDIVVPSSGGKDSSAVAHKLKHKYGMHPLTITWAPLDYTPIGWQNFRNFTKSGFNNLLFTQNGKLLAKLARLAFEAVGDVFLPFIYGQTSFAFHVALMMDIKLVFFGENPEAEYGGSLKYKDKPGIPIKDWADTYYKGVTVDDLVKYGLEETDYFTKDDYDECDLTFYRPPPLEELEKKDIQFHWFGFYEKWVPQENYYHAAENTGFQPNPEGRSEGTYSKYASLDDKWDPFHFYFSFIKFGIGRATSDASHEIRDGHITREEGTALVKKFDSEFPKKHFKEFLAFIGMDEGQFWKTVDKFRTSHIWKKENGEWKLRKAVYDEAISISR